MAAALFVRIRNLATKFTSNIVIQYNFSTSCALPCVLSRITQSAHRNEPENFDTLGTWDNRIDLPLLLQASIKHGKPIPKISIENVGTASVIGRRTTNEDRYKYIFLMTLLIIVCTFPVLSLCHAYSETCLVADKVFKF